MKKFILLLVFLGFSNAAISEVRPEYSGSWYNPSQSGHGFSIEVISPERSIAYWYTYDPFGESIFLVADGKNVGNRIEAKVYFYQGMVFGEFDPNTNQEWAWGTLTITFNDCSHATLQYNSTLQYQSGEIFGSGQMPLVRLTSMEGARCYDYPLAGVYAGTLYEEAYDFTHIGFGFVNENGKMIFASEYSVIVANLNPDEGTSGDLTAKGTVFYFEPNDYFYIESFSLDGGFDQDVLHGDTPAGEWLRLTKQVRDTTRSISMSDISGTWKAYSYVSGATVPLTIAANGAFSATDPDGCRFNGSISIPNPQLNVLESSVTVTGCSQISGTFTGLGSFFIEDPEIKGDEVMKIAGWNGSDDVLYVSFERP